ncbi:MAG: hypothetical protein HFF29_04450 [Oscillospiraceae bacterium]|nr:hypothetical protein [Oscillospiraceae bacterium]
MDMVGRLVLAGEKGRFRLEEDRLGPLEVVRAVVYAPEGLPPWRLRWRLRRAERALVRAGAGRVVLDGGFPYGDRLALLRPVDPLPFFRGCADVLALGALEAEGVDRRRGRVALSAPRLCAELERAAERLCPQVRGLLIDAPGGEDYARYLQARFGLPVTPPAAGADATVAFGPGGGRWGRCLELYGTADLGGLTAAVEEVELPEDCWDQVLALLWERGEVRRENLRVIRAGM